MSKYIYRSELIFHATKFNLIYNKFKKEVKKNGHLYGNSLVSPR